MQYRVVHRYGFAILKCYGLLNYHHHRLQSSFEICDIWSICLDGLVSNEKLKL